MNFFRNLEYNLTTPSAGRTGGVLTCLTKTPYALAAAQMNCYVNYKINIKHPEQT